MDIRRQLRRSFIAGVILVAPLAVTVFVLAFTFAQLVGILDPIVQSTRLTDYTGNVELAAQLLAALLLIGAVTLIGYLAQRSVGIRIVEALERLIGLIPVVSVIYSGVRQVSTALVERNDRYERVVLVEYPGRGVYSIGFVTGDAPPIAAEVAGQPVTNVYLPASPNPTNGRFVMAQADRVHETDISVSRGLRLLVTTGIAGSEAELEAFEDGIDSEFVQ